MLSRRLIRIKTFKVLFSYELSGAGSLDIAQKELYTSFEECRKLYYFMFNICSFIIRIAEDRIETLKNKFHPTQQEANPNYKFVNNGFVKFLGEQAEFRKICEKQDLGWAEYDVFLKRLYSSISSSDYYREYMDSEESSFAQDSKLFKRIFEEEFEDNEMLEKILEERSIYWTDDLAYVLNLIIWDIDSISKKKRFNYPDLFINEDDRDYAERLLRAAILNYDDYMKLITENLANWDSDRLVLTDADLIVLGLAEAVTFPEIPLKVTINEYVEISKYYSTPNSRIFVNGLLDKLIQQKVSSGEIVKTGRGLQDGETKN